MKTISIPKVKNELHFAIERTFEMEGVDVHTGIVILEAILNEYVRSAYETSVRDQVESERKYQVLLNEKLHGNFKQMGDVPEQQGTRDTSPE